MINTELTSKAERDLRYIYAKLPLATEIDLGLLSATIRGLDISGWDDKEYNRDLPIAYRKSKE